LTANWSIGGVAQRDIADNVRQTERVRTGSVKRN
jgi:hypothetical protein